MQRKQYLHGGGSRHLRGLFLVKKAVKNAKFPAFLRQNMMNGETLSVSHYYQPQKQEKKLETSQKNGSSGLLHWTYRRTVPGRHGLVLVPACARSTC